MINIKFKETPEQYELMKALGSKNQQTSLAAADMFAKFVGDVVQKVLAQAGTSSLFYNDLPFGEDENPSLPLDIFADAPVGHITVTSQNLAGGLARSESVGLQELKLSTYRLDSSFALPKKYARHCRLGVIAAYIERMAQELLIKQERNAWTVILKSLATGSGEGKACVLRAATADVFQVHDLNTLLTRAKRLKASFADGTPLGVSGKGITDLVVSYEMKEQVRSFAYQPMNTRSGAVATSGATAVPLPDSVREQIYRAAGASEIFGINILDIYELGIAQKYNTLFDILAGSTAYLKADGSGSAVFDGATEEILVGVDLGVKAFWRPVMREADGGNTVSVQVDNQFVTRQDKVGYFASVEEGRCSIDSRAVTGLVV